MHDVRLTDFTNAPGKKKIVPENYIPFSERLLMWIFTKDRDTEHTFIKIDIEKKTDL